MKHQNVAVSAFIPHDGKILIVQRVADKAFEQREINEIASLAFIGGKTNRRILSKEPIDYIESIVEKSGEEVLQSQLISLDRDVWKLDRYQDF